MASDGNSGKIPNASLAHGSQATHSIVLQTASGKSLPPAGKTAASAGGSASSTPREVAAPVPAIQPAAPPPPVEPQALVDQLNKHLNDSGRPDQYRLDPSGKLIQQVNPANGAVIGEFSVIEFPALARGVGATGLLLNSLA